MTIIKQHPEYTEKYPAIDGIPKGKNHSAIRSDIEKILSLNEKDFNEWYSTREDTIQGLIKDYKIVASIPDLHYSSENQQLGLDCRVGLGGMIEVLKEGLEYLDVIKKVYEDRHKD